MRMRPTIIVAVCFVATGISIGCASKSQPTSSSERTEPPQSSVPKADPQTPDAKAPAAELLSDTRPVVVTFGDSLTQGVEGKSYPAFLQDLLDERGYHYRVDNQGVSGDTSSDGLARIENVVATKPALVVLEFGGNDGLRGVPVENTRTNLEQMLERLIAAKITVVLAGITLPPNYGPDYVKPFTAIYPELAKRYHVHYMPFLLVHVFDEPGLMRADGIHPTEPGNRIVAQDVFDLIKPALKKAN
jgi:acyl-CoA thioesterase I